MFQVCSFKKRCIISTYVLPTAFADVHCALLFPPGTVLCRFWAPSIFFVFHSIAFADLALLLLRKFCSRTPQTNYPSCFPSSHRTYLKVTVSINSVVSGYQSSYQSHLVDHRRRKTSPDRILSEFRFWIYPSALPALTNDKWWKKIASRLDYTAPW